MNDSLLKEVVSGRTPVMDWVRTHVWHVGGLKQALVCLGAVAAAFALSQVFSTRLSRMYASRPALREWVDKRLPGFLTPLFSLIALRVLLFISLNHGWPVTVMGLAIKFVEAWLVIQLFASVLLPPGWTRMVTGVVAGLFILEVMGVLGPIFEYLDGIALTFDNERVSILELFKAVLLLSVMVPLIHKLCSMLEAGLERMADVKPRVRVLVTKLTRITLYIMAFVAALDLVGINLQMLTVFSGAVGLGVGFGLQKVVSNLVSGVILLLDNSIKPGDVIEVGGAYGWVESMNARFASMVTRDGKALLIPNDEMISNQVVNWSFTGHSVRTKIPITVAYDTDLRVAMELMLRACQGKERILEQPKPQVLLKSFGDDGIKLELRAWVQHPQKGMSNVASEIQMDIWDSFRASGIQFPYPQRDLHVKEPVTVRLEEPGGASADDARKSR